MALDGIRTRALLVPAAIAVLAGCKQDQHGVANASKPRVERPGQRDGPQPARIHIALAEPAVRLTPSSPSAAGMSAPGLDSAVALYRDAVKRSEIVGAVLLVARNGKVVLHEAIGWRNLESKLPMDTSAMFRMSSNTKPVIAAGVAILADEGRLRFSDSVKSYIPAFDNRKARSITVHQLLSHTSGLEIDALFAGRAITPARVMSWLRRDPPSLRREANLIGSVGAKTSPGTSYSYSNPGYNTLGALIEIVSGQPLDVFLRENIYDKLGMTDTYNREAAENLDGKLHRMGPVYSRREDGTRFILWKPGDAPDVSFVHASGGLVTTAWDYAVFMQMLMNGGSYGDTRLLRPETVQLMLTNHGPPGSRGYGYGWGINKDGTFTHSGSSGTYAWGDLSRGIIGVALTHTTSGAELRSRFMALVNMAVVQDSVSH
jgi:CubicO group peptidase (beta-lactamase class C family)